MPRPVEAPIKTQTKTLAATLLAVWCLMGTAGAALGAEAQEGRRLATQWCTACHIVSAGQAGSDAAPTFDSIANRAAFSEAGLRAWLADPHPPMPNLNLSSNEIERIIAYLRSLRRQ